MLHGISLTFRCIGLDHDGPVEMGTCKVDGHLDVSDPGDITDPKFTSQGPRVPCVLALCNRHLTNLDTV